MRIAKQDVPVRINAPGAVAPRPNRFRGRFWVRQVRRRVFLSGRRCRYRPAAQGLEGDLCQSPHWGYLIQGELTVTYADNSEEVIKSGDLFYWPPGHTSEGRRRRRDHPVQTAGGARKGDSPLAGKMAS